MDQSAIPGTRPANAPTPSRGLALAVLNVVVTEFGQVTLSQDGVGTNAGTGNVEIVKPAGATVRSAHFYAASTGFSGFMIPNGGIVLNGTPVNWAQVIPGPFGTFNHYAPVTGHVVATLSAAPAGIVPITVDESSNTSSIEGSILAVIWNDPSASTENTVNLLFGTQSTTGDQFSLNLGRPFGASDFMDMSVGISFGFQPTGQVSLIDVNGQRLSSCAGGHDDGQPANGALLTVGGTGDSNANPAPNCSGAAGPLVDDELYDLTPFVPVGSTTIQVNTSNPSNDDNIFYASFFSSVPTGVDEPPPDGGGEPPGGEECPFSGPSSPGVTRVNLLGITFITGTPGNDVIIGTPGRDVILAKEGDDQACGLGSDDLFLGGPGDDEWFGGSGTDVAFGHQGSDHLVGGPGSDRNDGGHTPVPSSVIDLDTDTCFGEANFLCEVSGPDAPLTATVLHSALRAR